MPENVCTLHSAIGNWLDSPLVSFQKSSKPRFSEMMSRNLSSSGSSMLIKSRPYFCHEQAPVLGTFSFLYYFQQKKYLNHFITELLEIELKVKAKRKVAKMILPIMRPSAAWDSRGSTVTRGGFERYFSVTGQGLAWAPCPGQPHSGPRSPELPAEDLPTLEAQDGPPLGAPGCRGPWSGRNDQ